MTQLGNLLYSGACAERSRTDADGVGYDGLWRRQAKVTSTATQYLYDGLNPVQELNGANPPGVIATLLNGLNFDEHFTRTDGSGNVSTFLTDALSSTVGLVGAGGTIATSYTYESFGATTVSGAANSNSYQFTGRENDGTTLDFYRARYYSPGFQRFVSQDPIDFSSGINLYALVQNQPTEAPDPSGEAPPGTVPPPIEVPINGPGSDANAPGDYQFPGPPGEASPPDGPVCAAPKPPPLPIPCTGPMTPGKCAVCLNVLIDLPGMGGAFACLLAGPGYLVCTEAVLSLMEGPALVGTLGCLTQY